MSIGKNGVITERSFSTSLLSQYDTNFYDEPDGSVWIKISHHNNPASYLFSSSDTFSISVYKDANRWFNVSLCNLISNEWELMVKQVLTSGTTEYKYRWIQKYNPMTCAYSDVLASNVTYNTSTGYSSSTFGGLFNKNYNAFLVADNGTNGSNWCGAIGAWVNYKGGIPAWNGQVVTTGYMDLYLRVDNITNTKVSKNKIGFTARDFIEW